MNSRIILALTLVFPVQGIYAADCNTTSSQLVKDHSFKPEVLNSKTNGIQTFAVNYNVDGAFLCDSLNTTSDGATPNPDATIENLDLDYSLQGTVAANNNLNPNNFIESQVSGDYDYSPDWLSMIGGAFGKYENTQTFDKRQTEIGFHSTFGKSDWLYTNTEIALKLNLGKVNPTDDPTREAVTGNTDPYYRWDGEAYVDLPINKLVFERFEYDYRYFKENGPSQKVVAAGLDRFRYEVLRLTFNFQGVDGKGLFFIAYASGQLPLDRQSDHIYEIGISFSTKGN